MSDQQYPDAATRLETVIAARDLTKRYGKTSVVDAINFDIAKGEVFGLLGPNGAGKTTTILMMLGLTEISGGQVSVLGFDPARQPHLRLCNDWTERVPHLAGPFANAVLARLVEMRGVAPHRIPRALRITDRGRAFFDRLGVQVPF